MTNGTISAEAEVVLSVIDSLTAPDEQDIQDETRLDHSLIAGAIRELLGKALIIKRSGMYDITEAGFYHLQGDVESSRDAAYYRRGK